MSQTSSHAQGSAPKEDTPWNHDWSSDSYRSSTRCAALDSPNVSPRSKPTGMGTTDSKNQPNASESPDIPQICIQDTSSEAQSGCLTTQLALPK
ncbi:hypothetical protein I203_107780 [Kwoniella mangroviensis CBS 8507]|uniref:hypothetical protein n=1 Tax=Kwoniella mangroviensis CBS 8507 TaxID=1296122 RepID=UPI00080CF07E|nr:uncharacterized protein I203_08331 [Kwoniella mangroviensis CBS 8507]OCF62591.1 hypothetical protein I203_08331 [Kwoniella mangroviensis CBS 8507]